MVQLSTDLWKLAYCDRYKYEALAEDAEPEDWGPNHKRLTSYVSYVYERAATLYNREQTGQKSDCLYVGSDRICFDTGLFTNVFEPIYALLEPNDEKRPQKWRLAGFYADGEAALSNVGLPSRVRFYDDPSELVYDYRLPLRVNRGHILGEHSERLPESFQSLSPREQSSRLEGAWRIAEKRVSANYALAVPQYFHGKIQLLLPLCLEGDSADVALVVEHVEQDGEAFYRGSTCLTLEMAYNNARLLCRPESSWLTV